MLVTSIDYEQPSIPATLLKSPPTLTLYGSSSVTLSVHASYTDPGAYASDALGRSLKVYTSGQPTATNWTSQATAEPLVILYTAGDAANHTVSGARTVTVVDACSQANAAEHTCLGVGRSCSVNGNCGAAAAALAGGSSGKTAAAAAAKAAAAAAFSAPDTTPPVITILGDGILFTTADGSTGMITSVQVGSNYVDAGATAIKIPSNAALPSVILTSSIVVRGLASVSTAVPTPPTQPLVISYDVADTAVPPNRALTVRRRLQVLCPTAEKICTSDAGTLYCSFGGICTGGSTGGSAAAIYTFWPSDSIVPQLSLNGPLLITLAANVPYAPCLGAMTSGCELGATASLNTTGDFDSKVIACENEVRECRGKGRGIGGSCPAVLLLSGKSVPSSVMLNTFISFIKTQQ